MMLLLIVYRCSHIYLLCFMYSQINEHAANLYDAVMLYAQALNTTLAAGGNEVRNGTAVISHVLGKTYQSMLVKALLVSMFISPNIFSTSLDKIPNDNEAQLRILSWHLTSAEGRGQKVKLY